MRHKHSKSTNHSNRTGLSLRRIWPLFILAGFSGCVRYHAAPITPDAVLARLNPPDISELRILASQIKHPILRPVTLDPKEGLSPDEAAVIAVLLNPSLRTIRNRRNVANAQLIEAGLLPNPVIAFGLDLPTASEATIGYGLGLSWNLNSLITRGSRAREAKAHKQAVDLDIAWQEWQVAQAAKAAVYRLFSLQKQISLAEQASACLAENLTQIDNAVVNGSLTVRSLNAAQAANRLANENLLSLRKQSDQQSLQLKQLMGLPADRKILLSGNIHLPSHIDAPPESVLLEDLEQRRLDLVALRRGYDSQEAAVRTAVLQQFPKIGIGPTTGRDTDNVRTAGISLNIELPIFNRNQEKIALEKATRKKLFDEYVDRVAVARSDIALIVSGIHFINEQVSAAKAAEIDLRRLVETYRTALMEGRVDALVYYSARKDLIDTRIKVIACEEQLAQAETGLELATGFYRIPATASTKPKREKTR